MKVAFLYHVANKDLYALFVDEQYNNSLMSYSHIGQHSSIHIDYVKESRLATKKEYQDLLQELKQIGYKDIEVRNEINVFEL